MFCAEYVDGFARAAGALDFAPPVAFVYNPLLYARATHLAYLDRFGDPGKKAVLLGMNPGPWGMAQTGVPFGEVDLVSGWMGIGGEVGRPAREHPARRVEGFACKRHEVSGKRLWGWARGRFGTAERFFADFFVVNYCPLMFMEAGGRNLTPDKLRAGERIALEKVCDGYLRTLVGHLEPAWVIGVGAYAEQSARRALAGVNVQIGRITHPSPANPAANRGWEQLAEAELAAMGLRF